MKMTRRVFIGACAALPLYARAQQWVPTQPIRLIVPYPPGASFDFLARLIAPRLSESLGQTIIVDNKGGAAGIIGTAELAKANPDGYTIGMGNPGTHTLPIALQRKTPYDGLKDFTPLCPLVKNVTAIAVNPKVPAMTLAELVSYVKKNPGKIAYGSAGAGTSPHLLGEMLNQVAGTDILHVGYKGGGPAMSDLLSGQVQIGFGTLATFLPHAKQGRLRILAVMDDTRFEGTPDIPTANEAFPGFDPRVSWLGMYGPRGLPPAVANRLTAELNKVLRVPEVKEKLVANGYVGIPGSPAELTSLMQADIAAWSAVVRKGNIKIE
jgi:tripartite-type tricarboxylate transporter receptor subunit TctC